MKDITEYLNKVKIKSAGFDIYDEKECLKAVKLTGLAIQYIHNPSEDLKLAAVNQNGTSIVYINNPTEEIQLIAVKEYGYNIRYIHNPTEEVIIEAVKQNEGAIQYIDIDKLSESTKEMLMYLV